MPRQPDDVRSPGQSGPCAPSAMIGSRLYLAGQLRRDLPLRSFEDVVEKTGMAVCDLGGRIAFGVAFLRSPSSILHLGTIIAQLWSTVYSCDSICCGAFRRFSRCFFAFLWRSRRHHYHPFVLLPFRGQRFECAALIWINNATEDFASVYESGASALRTSKEAIQ
jgi:hypothetical protein